MITIKSDKFNLTKIANSGQCFRFYPIDPNCYDVVAFNNVVRINQDTNVINFDCSEQDFDNLWKPYFSLDVEYPELNFADSFLQDAEKYNHGMRILRQDFWETVVSFIISQRKSITAIKTCINKLCENYGDVIPNTNYYTFPTATQLLNLTHENDCGLGYRFNYVIDACHKMIDEKFKDIQNLSYTDAQNVLKSVKGIGDKVSNCILLYGCNRLNAFPIDVWIQRMIDDIYDGTIPSWAVSDFAGYYQQLVFSYYRCRKLI